MGCEQHELGRCREAQLIGIPTKTDYQEGWVNGDKEVVEG
ncbi:hypothetical protein C2W64_03112 [Brevibacillus laterosporus]|nr:hypothetical protein C2W64_03112 [Brevibacillus laterosporus]